MPTTSKTSQSGTFAPGQLQNLQDLQNISVPLISGWMQNPTGNPWFQLQQSLGTRQAQNLGQTSTSDLLRNMTSSGMAGGASSPAGMEMLQNQSRANTGLQSQLGFLGPMQNAQQLQLGAASMAQNYRPFQTGQQTTQSTGGLGTWLPQVAGMGLQGLMGAFGGGGGFNFGTAGNRPSGGFAGAGINNPGMGAFGEGGAGVSWGGAMPGGNWPAGGGMGGNLGLGGASGGCMPGINC